MIDDKTRADARHSVSLVLAIKNQEQTIAGQSCNLSLGGICADVEQELGIGDEVEVEITLRAGISSEFVFRPNSRIVWCTAIAGVFQCGLQFCELSPEDRVQLQKFITYTEGRKP